MEQARARSTHLGTKCVAKEGVGEVVHHGIGLDSFEQHPLGTKLVQSVHQITFGK